jgi:hypothetical protein
MWLNKTSQQVKLRQTRTEDAGNLLVKLSVRVPVTLITYLMNKINLA